MNYRDTTFLHIAGCGGTSVIKSILGLPHDKKPVRQQFLPYKNGERHPRFSDMENLQDRLWTIVRPNESCYKSLKREFMPRACEGGG